MSLLKTTYSIVFVALAMVLPASASGFDFETHAGIKTGFETSASPSIPLGNRPDDKRPYKATFSRQYGPGFAIGPFVEARYPRSNNDFGYGLELGMRYSLDRASGTTTIETRIFEGETDIEQSQTAHSLHIPLVFEVAPPASWFELGDSIETSGGMGLEMVHQFGTSISYSRDSTLPDNTVTDTETATYALLTMNLGAEFDIGPIMMPVELRWGYNILWRSDFEDRTDLTIPGPYVDDKLVYNGAYRMHLGLFTGIT